MLADAFSEEALALQSHMKSQLPLTGIPSLSGASGGTGKGPQYVVSHPELRGEGREQNSSLPPWAITLHPEAQDVITPRLAWKCWFWPLNYSVPS